MRYILELVDEETRHGYDEQSTMESESYIPIPAVGEVIEYLGAGQVKVVGRRYWYTNVQNRPLVKVQLVCQRV